MDGDYDTAIELLTALGQEFPEDTRVMLLHAEILLQRRKPDEAVPLLEKCLEIDPEMLRANFQLGAAKVALKDSEGALAAFAREIELNDDKQVLMLAHLNRSMLLGQAKNWEGVIGELEAVLVIDPGNVQVYGDLASTYLRAGDADQAQAALERGVEAGFRSAVHYYSLGARRYKDEQIEQAVEAFQKALEIDPNMARAERSLGAALEQLDRNEEALVHLRRYLELAPNAPDASQIAEKIKQAEKG